MNSRLIICVYGFSDNSMDIWRFGQCNPLENLVPKSQNLMNQFQATTGSHNG